jgi:hypothetical protein
MKTLRLLFLATVMFITATLQAQVTVSVNFSPPSWGPAGYNQVRYYYLPDVEAYYDVQSSMFIYTNGGVWVHRAYLPERYRNYDLYGGYKVVMNDYHGNKPYSNFNDYKRKYKKGYHGQSQRTVGNRPDNRNNNARNSHQVNHNDHQNNRGDMHGNNNNGNRGNDRKTQQGNNKNDRGNGGGKGKNR